MKYLPPVKGSSLKKKAPKSNEEIMHESISKSFAESTSVLEKFKALRAEVLDSVKIKLAEIDCAIADIKKAESKLENGYTPVKGVDYFDGIDADEEVIIERVLSRIEIPKPDKPESVDYDKIMAELVAKIPTPKVIDERKLAKRVASMFPDKKGDLKIIRESVETDPMGVIDKIMALPDGKFKLKSKHIDGLDQTIRAMQSQLSKGYLHGAGVPSLTEGTGITLTKKSDGGFVVSATGNLNIYTETPVGDVDGINKVYTVTNNIGTVISFAINGMFIHKSEYTVLNNTITFISAPDASLAGKDFDIVYK